MGLLSTTMHQYEAVNTEMRQYSSGSSLPPYLKINDYGPQGNEAFLPPKNLATAKFSTVKRGLYQLSVGLGVLIVWGLLFGLWQWALNSRIQTWYNEYLYDYYYDYYDSELDSGWTPRLLMSTFDFYQPCDAAKYSSLEPTFLVPGNFTLSEAKAIDISFNLFVGRGIQAQLLAISYFATTDILMRLTENTPVRFDLFSALAFSPATFSTTYRVVKGIFNLRGWRGKCIMVWIFLSSVYLAILPTLVDTMSGYIQNQRKDVEYFEGENRVTVPYDSFNGTEWRLNHTGDYGYVCTQLEGYRWGLAETWVSITIILFGVWLLGTFTIWIDAQHACHLRRQGRGLETLRAVVDLAGAVHEVLGEEISAYSGKGLSESMEKSPEVMYGIEVDKNGVEQIKLGTPSRGLRKLSRETVYR